MRRRGFTLIEMSTIIVILAMISAIAIPSIGAVVKSQRIRGYFQDVERLTIEAHGIATQTGQTVSLVSDGEGSFQIQRQSEESTAEDEVTALGQVTTVQGIEILTFRLDSEDVAGDEWQLRFYGDGTADAGGILFQEAGETWAFSVDAKSGRGRIERGELPDATLNQWEAGDYVRRS